MGILDIGYTGVRAAQTQLNTVAMNIANEQTVGYTRRRVEQSAIGPTGNLGMNAGNGVEVTGIRRMANQYLISQTWRTNSQSEYYQMGQQYLDPIETILGDENTGLNAGIDRFFAALSESTTQPGSAALRQQIINESKSLATRFNSLNNFFSQQKAGIQTQRAATVESINNFSNAIATYNSKIADLESNGGDTSVLRDQRDELVKQMSGNLDVRVSEDGNGAYTVTMKNGQPLVSGRTVGTLSVANRANGEQELELTFSGTTFHADMSCGGQLGALYDYESGTLQDMRDSLQGIAEAVATAFNQQLADGFDKNGQPGKPLFIFDPSNPEGMLQVTDIKDDELAFSSKADEPGNGVNLQKLIDIKNKKMDIAGSGNMSISDASAGMISKIAIASRQNKTELSSASNLFYEAEKQRNNISGVDSMEEAMNLVTYTQLYQANLKVISTGDRIFNDLLGLF